MLAVRPFEAQRDLQSLLRLWNDSVAPALPLVRNFSVGSFSNSVSC